MIVEAGAMVALGDVSHGHSKEITCTRCRITNKVLKWLMFASFFSFSMLSRIDYTIRQSNMACWIIHHLVWWFSSQPPADQIQNLTRNPLMFPDSSKSFCFHANSLPQIDASQEKSRGPLGVPWGSFGAAIGVCDWHSPGSAGFIFCPQKNHGVLPDKMQAAAGFAGYVMFPGYKQPPSYPPVDYLLGPPN